MWSFEPLKKSLYSRPLIVRVSVGDARIGASVQLVCWMPQYSSPQVL